MERSIRIFSPKERPVVVISPQECIRILRQSGIDQNHAQQIIQSSQRDLLCSSPLIQMSNQKLKDFTLK